MLICERRRQSLYGRFPFIDAILPVDAFQDMLKPENLERLADTVLIPHGTLISQIDTADIERVSSPVFGNKYILKWESDRDHQGTDDAGGRTAPSRERACPRRHRRYGDSQEAGRRRRQGLLFGVLAARVRCPAASDLISRGVLSAGEPLYIQKYVSGVLAYLQFFYSPVSGQVEFFGCDQRHESDIEGLSRIPASNQVPAHTPSFNVIGNSPLVLRESLLDEAYKMAERFVEAAERLAPPGMNGPFCIEGVYDADGKFSAFEFSARIVAGTNIYMNGSPYYTLLFNEPLSMGRRIAREIKNADASGRLSDVTT